MENATHAIPFAGTAVQAVYALKRHSDTSSVLSFLEKEPVRYRHLIADLAPISSGFDKTGSDYHEPLPPPTYYSAAPHAAIQLVGVERFSRLRLEGNESDVSRTALLEWCQELNPHGVATTSESLVKLLREVFPDNWSLDFHFTATPEKFSGRPTQDIRLLGPEDRQAYMEFLCRPTGLPFLNVARADTMLLRDFEFMCQGVPVYLYAACKDNEIVGIAMVKPVTSKCEEITRVYVARECRGRGIGRSLFVTATRDIFARQKWPVCCVGGASSAMGNGLMQVGYHLDCCFYHRRYWIDLPQSGLSALHRQFGTGVG